MIVHREFQQGSVEWTQIRAGIPTASEFDNILTPEFKIRTGQMPQTYLAKKLSEAWLGGSLAEFTTFDIEQGRILEDEAIPWYELNFDEPVERVGFITTDDKKAGCSPDGLISEGGIEIKAPAVHTHVGYLLAGELPKDYACQVHGSMFVTGAPWWKFLSYRRRLPPLVLTVFRDEDIQKKIADALAGFLERFDVGWKRLVEMNGGREPIRPKLTQKPPPQQNDDVPIP